MHQVHQLHQLHQRHDGDHRPGPSGPPPAGCSARLRWSERGPTLVLGGEVDLSCASQLAGLGSLLQRHGQRVAVDAAGITFIDRAGLRAVTGLAGPGGSLLVLHPSPAVLHLLDVLAGSGLGPRVLRAGPREEAVVLREAG